MRERTHHKLSPMAMKILVMQSMPDRIRGTCYLFWYCKKLYLEHYLLVTFTCAASCLADRIRFCPENISAGFSTNTSIKTDTEENMYLENFILRTINRPVLNSNPISVLGKSSCLLCRKFIVTTSNSENVSKMDSRTEKLYQNICKGERAALGKNFEIKLIHYSFILRIQFNYVFQLVASHLWSRPTV